MRLSSLPEEFCGLHSLEHLDIEYSELRSLPNNFGDLVNLRHINLRHSWLLEMLPESFKQLIHLENLDLGMCSSLILESDILDQMTKLRVFNVSTCLELQVLPHNITNQASLRKLDFIETRSLRELPASIGQLSNLEELLINDCPLLTRLPASIGRLSNLEELLIDHCPLLTMLPTSLGNLSGLSTLTIVRCEKLYEIPSLASLVSLKTLRVCDCPEIVKIEGLEHLTSLEKLVVSTNGMLSGIHSLSGTERLQRVNLRAGNISTFEACIQSIEVEKWPWEMTVCGRIFPGVESIFDSFTFPGLAVVDSFFYPISHSESSTNEETILDPMRRRSLTCPETNLFNAAIVCFLAPSSGTSQLTGCEDYYDHSLLFHGSSGKWIVMREVSPLLEKRWGCPASITPADEPVGGWLVVGEKGSVVKGFKQLFQTLSARQLV